MNHLVLFTIVFIGSVMWLSSVAGLIFTLSNLMITLVALIGILWAALLTKSACDVTHDAGGEIKAAVVLTSLQLSFFLLMIAIPPFTGDEIAYSAALPQDYANARAFFYNEAYGAYSAFPQNYEAITTLSILIFDNTIVSKLCNFLMAIGLLVGVMILARFTGASSRLSILTGLLVGTSTVFVSNIPLVKNDIANGVFQVWCIIAVIQYYKLPSRSVLVLAAFLAGIAVGIKYTSLLFVLTPCIAFLIIILLNKESIKKKIIDLLAFGTVFVITALPWYLNNWILFGNPFHPSFSEWFPNRTAFDDYYAAMFKELYFDSLQNYHWRSGSIVGFSNELVKFGYIFVVGGGFGLLAVLIKPQNKESLLLALITIASLLITLRFAFWDPRYLIAILALLAAFIPFAISSIVRGLNFERYVSVPGKRVANLILISVALYGAIQPVQAYKEIQFDFLALEDEEFHAKWIPWWNTSKFINENIPKSSKIAVGGPQLFYHIDRPYYFIHPFMELGGLLYASDSESLLRLLKQQQVDYVLIDWIVLNRPDSEVTPLFNKYTNDLRNSVNTLIEEKKLIHLKNISEPWNFEVYVFKVQPNG